MLTSPTLQPQTTEHSHIPRREKCPAGCVLVNTKLVTSSTLLQARFLRGAIFVHWDKDGGTSHLPRPPLPSLDCQGLQHLLFVRQL